MCRPPGCREVRGAGAEAVVDLDLAVAEHRVAGGVRRFRRGGQGAGDRDLDGPVVQGAYGDVGDLAAGAGVAPGLVAGVVAVAVVVVGGARQKLGTGPEVIRRVPFAS
ncbi:hypothetical protein SHKM778_33830 [Streptomyces sp. KM77-8]|uniref:Uncharacterized protein n=1 Tax=Streptomyces haneummycinicus TaxID=3074435 RepID=A0AAT9HHZ9_9ACTN